MEHKRKLSEITSKLELEEVSSSEEEQEFSSEQSDSSSSETSATDLECSPKYFLRARTQRQWKREELLSSEEEHEYRNRNSGSNSSDSSVDSQLSGIDSKDLKFLFKNASNYYVLKHSLSSGSYGRVYSAIKRPDNHLVAIKVIKTGVGFTDRHSLRIECQIIKRLMGSNHKNIVTFHEIRSSPDRSRAYIVSELTEIGDIFKATQRTDRNGDRIWVPFRELEAQHLIHGIAQGLRHMHSLGIAHGDLKPENILLFWNINRNESQPYNSERIDRYLPKITDFSNSRMRRSRDPPNQIIKNYQLCSISYAAPESCDGSYDFMKADVFSVGCVLLAMLLGARPYNAPFPSPKPNSSNYSLKREEWNYYCNELKKDFGYTRDMCRVFNPQLRQVLLRLLDPSPESRLTLDQFLSDQLFRT